MPTYLGSPAPTSIAIFAGASARERGFGSPALQARANFGASYASEADRITQEAFDSIPGASAAQGGWDWNAAAKAAGELAGGLGSFLASLNKQPVQEANVPLGQTARQDPTVVYVQPPPTAPAASAIPPWVIALAIAAAVAAGWVLLSKRRR